MRVMLTGATGFLGGHLLAQLRATVGRRSPPWCVRPMPAIGIGASGVDPDARFDRGSGLAARGPGASRSDAVFHVAADTSQWRGHVDRQTRTNVEGTRNVIEAAAGVPACAASCTSRRSPRSASRKRS